MKIKSVEKGEFELNGKSIVIPDDESPGLTWNHISAILSKHQAQSAVGFWLLPLAYADEEETRLSANQAIQAMVLQVVKDQQGVAICQTILVNADICPDLRRTMQKSNEQNSQIAKAGDPNAKSSVDQDNFEINDPVNVDPKTHKNAIRNKLIVSLKERTQILQNFMAKDAAKSCPYYAEGVDCINQNLNDAALGLKVTPTQLPGGATTGGVSH